MWFLRLIFETLGSVASDTCEALTEFIQTPVNTTLDNFLPCLDSNTTDAALLIVREGASSIVQEVCAVPCQAYSHL